MKKNYVTPITVSHVVETEAPVLAGSTRKLEMEWSEGSGSTTKNASTSYEVLSKEHSNGNGLWDDDE